MQFVNFVDMDKFPLEPSGPWAGAYPSFCSMKQLGVFLLPSAWDATPSQGYPSSKFAGRHLHVHVDGERHNEV